MSHQRRLTVVIMLLFGLHGPAAAIAQEGAKWIKDFVSEQDKWPRLVGADLRIEGRYSVMGQSSLKFRGCDLDFRFAPGVLPLMENNLTIEVRGRLQRDGNELFFDVTRIDEIPSDLERLRAMRGDIDSTDPEAWYELADWARQRGDFYDDEDLRAEAAILARNGISTEYDQIGATDGPALRTLAEKVRGLGLSDSLRMEFMHESLRRDFSGERSKPEPNYAIVLGNVTRLLPGANVPLDREVRDNVIDAYQANPLTYYQDSDNAGRLRCHRAFYVDLTQRIILATARDDGSNGDAIAQRFRGELPEFPELAIEWEKKFLDYEHSRVAVMTRAEMLALSDRFLQRGDQPGSEQVRRDWLAAREADLAPNDVQGLMQLAENYEELVQDDDQAAEYMLDAYALTPNNEAIANWLREHGYIFVSGEWVLEVDVPDHPLTETERHIRDGVVRPGMTREDVSRALGGAPSSTVRIASSRRVTELWIYAEHNIYVKFVQNANRDAATVDEVLALPALP